jgi:hypothetical protein
MLSSFLNSLFGCAHQRTTFPITPGRRNGLAPNALETRGRMYVACLDCGQEFDYDWKSMRVGEPVRAPMATSRPSSIHG